MKQCEPELTLWDWLAQDSNAHYLDFIEKTGGAQGDYEIKPITNIDTNKPYSKWEANFIDWISANRATVRKSQYNEPQYKPELFQHMNGLSSEVGFNRLNTTDYSWGVFDQHNDELKIMLGGKWAFKRMKVRYDCALVRLLVQMPGHFQPWHFDTMSSWAETYPLLNPHIVTEDELVERVADGESVYDMADEHYCDEGKIVRRLVCVSEWSTGHMIELEKSFFPNWSAGDVFDIPACIWHLSANAGVDLKITAIVTGIEDD